MLFLGSSYSDTVVSAVYHGGFHCTEGVLGFCCLFMHWFEQHWRQVVAFSSYVSVLFASGELFGIVTADGFGFVFYFNQQ